MFVWRCRSWFSSTSSEVSLSSSTSSVDMAGGDAPGGGVGGAVERWNVFGPRPLVHKSASDLGSDPSNPGKGRSPDVISDQTLSEGAELVCCCLL